MTDVTTSQTPPTTDQIIIIVAGAIGGSVGLLVLAIGTGLLAVVFMMKTRSNKDGMFKILK